MLSILLVDDTLAFRQAMEQFLLRQEGFRLVGMAANGQEALDLARSLHPDIILIDLRMPVLSGLDAIPRLRSLLPDTGIIVLSVMEEEAYRLVSADLGADAYVSKAHAVTQLTRVIKRVAAQRKRSAPEEFPPVQPFNPGSA